MSGLEYRFGVGELPGVPKVSPERWVWPVRRTLLAGEFTPAEALRLTRDSPGQIQADCLAINAPFLFVSGRVAEALTNAGCSGWDTYPVDVDCLDGSHTAAGAFVGISVHGRCELDWSAAREEWNEMFIGNPPMRLLYGPSVVNGSWGGEDLVLAAGSTLVLCTEKVRTTLRTARVRGIRYELLSELLDPNWPEYKDHKH